MIQKYFPFSALKIQNTIKTTDNVIESRFDSYDEENKL